MKDSFRPPQQERSRKTLGRFYRAAEALFADEAISDVTVPKLAAAAGSSVGAFYARFGGKDDFLAAFYRHYFTEARERLLGQLEPGAWVGKTAEAVVRGVIALRADYYVSRRRLLAHLLLHVRLTRDDRFVRPARMLSDEMFARLRDLLGAGRADLPTAPPVKAVRNGVITADAGLREFFVFGRGSSSASAEPHRAFVEDTATMLWLLLSQATGGAP
jgi:AcrR family transcriptional regulator